MFSFMQYVQQTLEITEFNSKLVRHIVGLAAMRMLVLIMTRSVDSLMVVLKVTQSVDSLMQIFGARLATLSLNIVVCLMTLLLTEILYYRTVG